MAETQHTPGPWSPFDTGFCVGVSPDDEKIGDIAHCGDLDSFRSAEEVKANARLIAAAPDMLEALKTVDALGMLNPTGSGAVEDAARAVKSAIAKAEAR